jgi:hypothetical protein
MEEWQWRNNLLIFGTEECPQGSYFDTLTITEDILRIKQSGHFELAYRQCS